jgi:hypothetical protein
VVATTFERVKPTFAARPEIWNHGDPMPAKRLIEERAHDVLAAEEFPMPAPDPVLHHGPVVLPDDPTGIEQPHDVLAAEEFPMPAARLDGLAVSRRTGVSRHLAVKAAAGTLLVLLALRMLRRA